MTTDEGTQRLPLVLTGHALQSLRDSGFSVATALAEPVDNSIEARANAIRIVLDEGKDPRGRTHVDQIAIVDDGDGMDHETLFHYLQLGFSTRYMSTITIGKYGVGAKLAALNYAKAIDVWSRADSEDPWLHVSFDLGRTIDEEKRGEIPAIDPPAPDPIPETLAPLLPSGTGTLVVWSKIDRLEEGRHARDVNQLRVDIEKELSRIFRRYLEGGIRIWVNDTKLLPHDPLFLMERTWATEVVLKHHNNVRAKVMTEQEELSVNGSKAYLTVTVYPREVVRRRGQGGDDLAKKLRVPENQGSISFVRLNREIAYTNVPKIFPRGVEAADRFIGIEVSFDPTLDESFGVRNVKRGVEPHGDLRATIRKRLQKYVRDARTELERLWGEAQRESKEHHGEHAQLTEAVRAANRTLPKSRAKGPDSAIEQEAILDQLAKDVGIRDQEAEAYKARTRDLPFVVESVEWPGSNFVDVQHLGHQVIIRLNTRHRFYREVWEPLREVATNSSAMTVDQMSRAGRRGVEAIALMLIAYGKAESMNENPHERYGELRSYWGIFLDSLMGKVKDVI